MLFAVTAFAQEGLGDPTQPTAISEKSATPGKAASAGPRWRLQSTLLSDERRLAVINGHTLREGEHINGARLLEVLHNGVVLEVDGRRLNLRLQQDTIQVKRVGG